MYPVAVAAQYTPNIRRHVVRLYVWLSNQVSFEKILDYIKDICEF